MTLHVAVVPSTEAVILHDPGLRAVIRPFSDTLAMLGLLDFHLTVLSFDVVAVIPVISPQSSVMLFLLSFTVVSRTVT